MIKLVNMVVGFELNRVLECSEAIEIARRLGVPSIGKKPCFKVPGVVFTAEVGGKRYRGQIYRRSINISGFSDISEVREMTKTIHGILGDLASISRIVIRNMIYVADLKTQVNIRRLGVSDIFPGAVVEINRRRILVFSSGKIVIPGVQSEEEAVEILSKIEELVSKNTIR